MRTLELLAPARDADTAIQAILHGADAVYMGADRFGARQNARNSVADIARVADFAHKFNARVYVTVNTIIKENELPAVEALTWELYRAGADALIVQDMAMLRLNLPPIALHASTQCHNDTVEKAQFLENVGFSQIVLARELALDQIHDICNSVKVPVEVFVHGALCVSYSGRCHASCVTRGRSANRGECAQLCRLPYVLEDAKGRRLTPKRHLLSLKDLNTIDMLDDLIEAGASSFKIEGRLKDPDYVKNVVAAYSQRLNEIVAKSNGQLRRSSVGRSEITFTPNLHKSFNRGFTTFNLNGKRPKDKVASILTPKSLGEPITDTSTINNGDGLSFFNSRDEYEGFMVNGVKNGRIIPAKRIEIPKNARLYRTFDRQWENTLKRETAVRKIWYDVILDATGVTATDERGLTVRLPLPSAPIASQGGRFEPEKVFAKTGNTIYSLRKFSSSLAEGQYIPPSVLTGLRRELTALLDNAAKATYKFDYRRAEDRSVPYPLKHVDYSENVANSLAKTFYEEHGVRVDEMALEVSKPSHDNDLTVMRCGYCVLRQLGMCKKDNRNVYDKKSGSPFDEPLYLVGDNLRFRLSFDCSRCLMYLHYS